MRLLHLTLILSALAALGLAHPQLSQAAGVFAIFDNLPMTGSTDVPTGLTMGAGQGITLYYTVGDFAKCKPIESSFNRQTVTLSSVTDINQYGFFSVEANLNETTNRYFRLKDPTLSELQPQTTYTLTLAGGDQGIAISCSTILATTTYRLLQDFSTTFTTGRDTVSPTITNIKSQVRATQASISWSTDQPADSQVAYGISPSLGQFTQPNTQLSRSQSANLTGLIPGMVYYYQVLSKDAAGNLSTASGQFSTLVITGLKTDQLGGNEATISWTTNQPTDSIVELGPTTTYIRRAGNYTPTTQHSVSISNLDAKTIYHFRVRATGDGGTSYSADQVFETTDAIGSTQIVLPPLEVDEVITPDILPSAVPQVLAATDTGQQASSSSNLTATPRPTVMATTSTAAIWLGVPVILAGLCAVMFLLQRHQRRISRLRQPS